MSEVTTRAVDRRERAELVGDRIPDLARHETRSLKCASAGQAPCSSDSATPPRINSTRIAARQGGRPEHSLVEISCLAACLGSMIATVSVSPARAGSVATGDAPILRTCFGRNRCELLAAPDRMAARGDLRAPGLLDLRDQRCRQRHVIELGGHRGAVLVGPGEELECLLHRLRDRVAACTRRMKLAPVIGQLFAPG